MVEEAWVAGGADDLLKAVPGKLAFSMAAEALGKDRQTILDLVCKALAAEEDHPLASLGRRLETALENYLPSRHQ